MGKTAFIVFLILLNLLISIGATISYNEEISTLGTLVIKIPEDYPTLYDALASLRDNAIYAKIIIDSHYINQSFSVHTAGNIEIEGLAKPIFYPAYKNGVRTRIEIIFPNHRIYNLSIRNIVFKSVTLEIKGNINLFISNTTFYSSVLRISLGPSTFGNNVIMYISNTLFNSSSLSIVGESSSSSLTIALSNIFNSWISSDISVVFLKTIIRASSIDVKRLSLIDSMIHHTDLRFSRGSVRSIINSYINYSTVSIMVDKDSIIRDSTFVNSFIYISSSLGVVTGIIKNCTFINVIPRIDNWKVFVNGSNTFNGEPLYCIDTLTNSRIDASGSYVINMAVNSFIENIDHIGLLYISRSYGTVISGNNIDILVLENSVYDTIMDNVIDIISSHMGVRDTLANNTIRKGILGLFHNTRLIGNDINGYWSQVKLMVHPSLLSVIFIEGYNKKDGKPIIYYKCRTPNDVARISNLNRLGGIIINGCRGVEINNVTIDATDGILWINATDYVKIHHSTFNKTSILIEDSSRRTTPKLKVTIKNAEFIEPYFYIIANHITLANNKFYGGIQNTVMYLDAQNTLIFENNSLLIQINKLKTKVYSLSEYPLTESVDTDISLEAKRIYLTYNNISLALTNRVNVLLNPTTSTPLANIIRIVSHDILYINNNIFNINLKYIFRLLRAVNNSLLVNIAPKQKLIYVEPVSSSKNSIYVYNNKFNINIEISYQTYDNYINWLYRKEITYRSIKENKRLLDDIGRFCTICIDKNRYGSISEVSMGNNYIGAKVVSPIPIIYYGMYVGSFINDLYLSYVNNTITYKPLFKYLRSGHGLYIDSLSYKNKVTIIDNRFFNCSYTLSFKLPGSSSSRPEVSLTFNDNIVNNKQAVFINGLSNKVIEPSSIGDVDQIIVYNCSDIIIKNFTFRNIGYPIIVFYSDGVSIVNNTFEDIIAPIYVGFRVQHIYLYANSLGKYLYMGPEDINYLSPYKMFFWFNKTLYYDVLGNYYDDKIYTNDKHYPIVKEDNVVSLRYPSNNYAPIIFPEDFIKLDISSKIISKRISLLISSATYIRYSISIRNASFAKTLYMGEQGFNMTQDITLDLSELKEGEYRLVTTAYILFLGVNISKEYVIIIDRTPPQIAVTKVSRKLYANGEEILYVNYTCKDKTLYKIYIEIVDKISGQTILYSEVQADKPIELNLSSLRQGYYLLKIVAVDKAGNNASTTYSFIVVKRNKASLLTIYTIVTLVISFLLLIACFKDKINILLRSIKPGQ